MQSLLEAVPFSHVTEHDAAVLVKVILSSGTAECPAQEPVNNGTDLRFGFIVGGPGREESGHQLFATLNFLLILLHVERAGNFQ